MPTVVSKLTDIQGALDALAKQHKVPGASLGILSGDEVVEFATGVANKNSGLAVTPKTLFQIGSNTKVYTATLVMQLVDEGKVDLDEPVKKYLPEFRLADAKALEKITVRHLLTHTNGIDAADYFDDYGRGDDGIEKFVKSLKNFGQVYPPGEMWSYCNSAFVVAGRLIEKLRGVPYHKAMRDHLLAPLGCNATTILMEEMLARSCAVGHMAEEGGEPAVPASVMMSPSHAPAGSMTASNPREVLRFVRMHLDGGVARNGKQVLSAESARAMQQPQVKLGKASLGESMGIGWILSNWDGERLVGHGGGTIGQLSFLQVMPDRRFALILLTNSNTGGALWTDLSRYLFEEFTGVKTPQLPKPPEDPPKVDLSRYIGKYERTAVSIELKLDDGKLVGTMAYTGPLEELAGKQEITLNPIDKELFQVKVGDAELLAEFLDFDRSGRPRYINTGRVSRRLDDGAQGSKRKAKPARAATKSRKSTPKKRSPRRKAPARSRRSRR